jgi:hypothetical protein
MSITRVPNKNPLGAIRTSVHFIRSYFDAQALPNTPPPSPLPNLTLLSRHHQKNNKSSLKINRIADELIDMYSAENNKNQKLEHQIVQLTKERESLKQQLTDCEQSTQQMVCHYVGLLEKERLETKKWMSLATKQEQLVSTLEKKQLKYQVQENELEDKQKLLGLLINERHILIKRMNSKTPPLLLKPSTITTSKSTPHHRPPIAPISKSKRSSIDLLEQMVKTDLLMYTSTPIKTDTILPPSPPPHIPLPQLPHHTSTTKKKTCHRSQPPLPKSAIKSKLNQTHKRETMPENKHSLFSSVQHHKYRKYRKDGHFISF